MSVRDSLSVVTVRRLRALLVAVGLTVAVGVLWIATSRPAGAAGLVAQATTIDDSSSTRRVQLAAGGLAVLGVGLIGLTIWFWRSTRPDPEPLAPLELMGSRRWRRADAIERRHLLDEVRAHVNDDAAEAARLTVDAGTTGPPSASLAALATPAPPMASDTGRSSAQSGEAAQVAEPAPSETPPETPPHVMGEPSEAGPRPVHGDPLVRAHDGDG